MSLTLLTLRHIAPCRATCRSLHTMKQDDRMAVNMSHHNDRLRSLLQRNSVLLGGVGTVAAAAISYNKYNPVATETVLGFQRQLQFWYRIFPVVFDYYWRFASSSPYVKYQKFSKSTPTASAAGSDEIRVLEERRQNQLYNELLNAAHERNAIEVYQSMLDLKGLYIKLGQILSVSVLPVPEPYRVLFRTLQSDVPGWQEFESVVEPMLKREFGVQSLDTIFSFIDPIPCGAASIGQAHRATLAETGEDVILKVQYPDAAWQVPADIQCVGDFLSICVLAGVVEKEASILTFHEFSRQFLAELDYDAERRNLDEIYASSVQPNSPYRKRGVVVPRVYPELCTKHVITMTYLPGPKLEQEARRQLEMFGIDTSRGFKELVRETVTSENSDLPESVDGIVVNASNSQYQTTSQSWKITFSQLAGRFIGFDTILWAVRTTRRLILLSTAAAVTTIRSTSPILVPSTWEAWAEAHQFASEQAGRVAMTESWIDALFDVHGHQVFNLGLFNADPHPGNIIVLEEPQNKSHNTTRLGLIDFGQCKRLTGEEQVQVAHLIVSVANNESDEAIADAFRGLGIRTQNDSTEFLADFARLMFGSLQPHHMSHKWHQELHKLDKVVYFPQKLSMVYRSALLLRGLALSLQINTSVGVKWQHHAQEAIDRHAKAKRSLLRTSRRQTKSHPVMLGTPLLASN